MSSRCGLGELPALRACGFQHRFQKCGSQIVSAKTTPGTVQKRKDISEHMGRGQCPQMKHSVMIKSRERTVNCLERRPVPKPCPLFTEVEHEWSICYTYFEHQYHKLAHQRWESYRKSILIKNNPFSKQENSMYYTYIHLLQLNYVMMTLYPTSFHSVSLLSCFGLFIACCDLRKNG